MLSTRIMAYIGKDADSQGIASPRHLETVGEADENESTLEPDGGSTVALEEQPSMSSVFQHRPSTTASWLQGCSIEETISVHEARMRIFLDRCDGL